MWVVVTVVAVVVLTATYLTWTATRVDRLHIRAEAALAALDATSVQRATLVATLAQRHGLTEIQTAAKAVLGAEIADRGGPENDLTRALRALRPGDLVDTDGEDVAAVERASRQLALARHVHTDLVRDALAVRRRWLVRLLRLTRRHPAPQFYDIDDT